MSLTRTEAEHRAGVLAVSSYDVELDLSRSDETFSSVTTVRFRSEAAATFVDVKPRALHTARLDGAPLSPDLLADGRMMNLAGREPKGNSLESMDLGFLLQSLSLERVATAADTLTLGAQPVPEDIDREIARRMLAALSAAR